MKANKILNAKVKDILDKPVTYAHYTDAIIKSLRDNGHGVEVTVQYTRTEKPLVKETWVVEPDQIEFK